MKNNHILFQDKNEDFPSLLSLKSFYNKTGIEYLKHLEFESKTTKQHFIDQTNNSFNQPNSSQNSKKTLPKEILWLGAFFAKFIDAGDVADIKIQWSSDEIGFGVFANSDISAHQYIGKYTGLAKKRFFFQSIDPKYCFCYPSYNNTLIDQLKKNFIYYFIDASLKGNETRFINHSDHPNVEACAAFHNNIFHIIFRSTTSIPKNTELTFNYGDWYWNSKSKV